MAEQEVAAEDLPPTWREALTVLAHRTRAMLRRHPWAVGGMVAGAGGGAGPHALRQFEQSLAAVASTGLPAGERIDVIAALDDYVAGFVLKSDLEPGLESVPEEAGAEVAAYLDAELRTGRYPHLKELLGDGDPWVALRGVMTAANDRDSRFERGLRRLLDGVAAEIDRAAR